MNDKQKINSLCNSVIMVAAKFIGKCEKGQARSVETLQDMHIIKREAEMLKEYINGKSDKEPRPDIVSVTINGKKISCDGIDTLTYEEIIDYAGLKGTPTMTWYEKGGAGGIIHPNEILHFGGLKNIFITAVYTNNT